MAYVVGCYVKAEMQRCCPDQEVLEGDDITLGGLLALDASGALGNLQSQRMHDQIVKDTIDEDATLLTCRLGSGPINAMC